MNFDKTFFCFLGHKIVNNQEREPRNNHRIISRALNWIKKPTGTSAHKDETMSLTNISKAPNQISFRPRRQTERSSLSETTTKNIKVSSQQPSSTSGFINLSNFAMENFSHSLNSIDYLETVSLSNEKRANSEKLEVKRFSN